MSLPANFYLPPSARIHDEAPKFRCRVCQEPFWDRTAFGRHVVNCSNANEDRLRAETLRGQNPWMFDDQAHGDVEFRDYVRSTGKWH